MLNRRVDVLDSLRGIAALSVVLYHFKANLPPGILRYISSKGYLGVGVFFVISGFVIPYALHNSDYRVSSYGRFILKRLIRLEPPYLISIILVLLVKSSPSSLTQILLHLGYLNVFFQYDWLIPIYWTLAVELQFYLMIGLIYPLLKNYWIPVFLVFGSLPFLIRNDAFIFRYLFLFLLGMATYKYFVSQFTRSAFLVVVSVLTTGLLLSTYCQFALAGLLTCLTIAFVRWNPLRFFGLISYSLYLIHLPVGNKFLNLTITPDRGALSRYLFVTLAVVLSIGAAYLLYRFVERPAQKWAKRIVYDSRDDYSPKFDLATLRR